MSGIEILTTILFSTFLQIMTDTFFDLKYDLYGYFNKGVDWGGMLYILGIFPAVNTVYLNFFPYKKELKDKLLYVFYWTVISVVFEDLFLWSGTFYYNGWKLWYSAIIYPFLYFILVLFHKYACYLLKRNNELKG
ncbi:CBO0543 family protein [Metabacillus sp. YM-086]|uniref:CBO0543 family protein n=1 Tax=Metabacillus sp. YM-086 TaxID=3341729 RepID=UPI003A88656E